MPSTINPVWISLIVFAFVFGGALLGMVFRQAVPDHHLSGDSKEVIKLGVGLIGTMAALLLGLLVASAKESYDTRSSELTQMAANVILLDRMLAHYGPETGAIRQLLRTSVARITNQIWSGNSNLKMLNPGSGEVMFDMIETLKPHTDEQHTIQSQAESTAITLGQMRLLLFEQGGSSISKPFLVVIVFWLAILFVGFGLLTPRNATVTIALLLSALSVAGAIFLILELDHPFSGLIQISSLPLRNALAAMGH